MLLVSLECPFLIAGVPYVASFSELSIFDEMDNSEKLATQGKPAIKNGQSRETSNIGYTGYQKWTIQRN
jgi:hypothetical protein